MPSELSKATARKVISPPEYCVEIDGVEMLIKPLPDAEIERVGDAISSIVEGLRTIAGVEAVLDVDVKNITFKQISELVPLLITALVPTSTKLIAAALRTTPEWVQDHIRLKDRVALLDMIIDAEGIREILGELLGLAKSTVPNEMIPALTNQPLTEEAPISQSAETQATSSTKSGMNSRRSKSGSS